jgi:hypothetical protein
MESFYWIVLVIAIVARIGSLTYVGILMTYYTTKVTTYPPVAASCPDFWSISSTNECIIPSWNEGNGRNIGSLYTVNTNVTPNTATFNDTGIMGLSSDKTSINISDSTWGVNAAGTCAKQQWAKTYGIVWDGVSNYNSC